MNVRPSAHRTVTESAEPSCQQSGRLTDEETLSGQTASQISSHLSGNSLTI